MSGWFDGVGEAKVSKTGQWFQPGKYRVKIKSVKQVTGQKAGERFLVIETVVLESNNPEIQVGSEKSEVIKMQGVMALPNIKAFIGAVSGIDATLDNATTLIEEYWQKHNPTGARYGLAEIIEELVVKYNVLENIEMGLECVMVTTQQGNPFTKHIWQVRQD